MLVWAGWTLLQLIRLFAQGVLADSGWNGASEAPPPAGVRLDLNRASYPELMLLPGLGPGRAAEVVLSRLRHGPFSSPESLLRVPGIGRDTVDRLAPHIEVGARSASAESR